MPYSKDQKIAASIALAVKEGKLPKSKLKGASLSMYNSMDAEELRDFAKGYMKKRKGKSE